MKFRADSEHFAVVEDALLAVFAGDPADTRVSRFRILVSGVVCFVPLLIAVDREKESTARSFVCGWLFGFVFFTGTCWWLTYAPITLRRISGRSRLLFIVHRDCDRGGVSGAVCGDHVSFAQAVWHMGVFCRAVGVGRD